MLIPLRKTGKTVQSWEHTWDLSIEKGIRIEYPYNFGLPLGNSAFVTIWLEFDLLVRTIVQI